MKTQYIANEIGHDSMGSFIDSLIHPGQLKYTAATGSALGTLEYFFEHYIGMAPAVGFVILMLFGIEMFTGIKASKLEGKGFSSKKFTSGFVKMAIYFITIGLVHLLDQNIEPKKIMGAEINIYEWLHYFFLNFVILQLLISNLENFNRLGWGNWFPAINKITKFLGIKDKNKEDEHNKEK